MEVPSPIVQVGRIPFLVCAPFFHRTLSSPHGFVDGTPAQLNALLHQGIVHLAPSSSIEFALHPDQYLLDPQHCTAGTLEVRSVRLFSHVPLQQLDGCRILPSPASATSNALARILLHQRFQVRPRWLNHSPTSSPNKNDFDACVLIGDQALLTDWRREWEFSYDLGTLWHAWQGNPFVFGAWQVRRDAATHPTLGHQVCAFLGGLEQSIAAFRANPREALEPWMQRFACSLPLSLAVDYFGVLDYRFGEGHRTSLKQFYQLCAEEGIIASPPELAFLIR